MSIEISYRKISNIFEDDLKIRPLNQLENPSVNLDPSVNLNIVKYENKIRSREKSVD